MFAIYDRNGTNGTRTDLSGTHGKKELAQKARDDDKETAKENLEVLSFNFDLEAVLPTPKGQAQVTYFTYVN